MAPDLNSPRHAVTPHRHLVAEMSHSRGESFKREEEDLLDNSCGSVEGTPCLRGPGL